jgi:hypothetical protein
MAAPRDITVGGATIRYSCAAMAILDPEDALAVSEVFRALGKVPFLKRAVLAGLEGYRLKANPAGTAYTLSDAEALIDGVGVKQAMTAVSDAALAYFNPEWNAEGAEVPKA